MLSTTNLPLSSLGVNSEDLAIPLGAFAAGLGDHKINTALCPGGKERMRRLMNVLESGRLDLGPLVTHEYKLDKIVEAYDLFGHQRDGVLAQPPAERRRSAGALHPQVVYTQKPTEDSQTCRWRRSKAY